MKLQFLCLFLFMLLGVQSVFSQVQNHVSGYTYHRYGEEIGLLGNRFIAYVPNDYDENKLYRVIAHSHGAGGNPEQTVIAYMNSLNLHGIDDVIVIFTHQTWIVGEWRFTHPDFVGTQHILNHFHKIRRDYNVYEKIMLTGFSLGGQFALSFGMFQPDELIASVPMGFGGSVTQPSGAYYVDGVRVDRAEDVKSDEAFREFYFPYITTPPPQSYKALKWLIATGDGEGTGRTLGHQVCIQGFQDDGADFQEFVYSGGHDFTPALHDSLANFYINHIQRDNIPPVANANISRTGNLSLSFDASESTDPDGSIVRYEWLLGDGNVSDQSVLNHTYTQPGLYEVRLRVTDNENDMKTLYQSLKVTEHAVEVYDPIETDCFRVGTGYNEEYEFTISDFKEAVSRPEDLQKIRINSHPQKGLIMLNGVPLNTDTSIFRTNPNQGIVSIERFDASHGYVVDVEDIPFLSYLPMNNEGEDFIEYSAYDGNVWCVHHDSRINIDIDAPEGRLFSNIRSSSGRDCAIGFLGEGTMYFTNEQSSITRLPEDLRGMEIIRTHSDDRGLSSENALSFTISEDATLYVAYDGRYETTVPPDWLTSEWTLVSDDELYSWFYFMVYKKEFSAGTVVLGGNKAPGYVDAARMYFVLGEPSGNIRPTLLDSIVESVNDPVSFSSALFADLFVDRNADVLSTIKITRLPQYGTLTLNGVSVEVNQEISPALLNQLSYTADPGYSGFDNFKWNASDGTAYAEFDAKIHFDIQQDPSGQNSKKMEFYHIYPNPVQDKLLIQYPEANAYSLLKIYDLQGILVLQQRVASHDVVAVGDLPAGVYLVQINGMTVKMIKQ